MIPVKPGAVTELLLINSDTDAATAPFIRLSMSIVCNLREGGFHAKCHHEWKRENLCCTLILIKFYFAERSNLGEYPTRVYDGDSDTVTWQPLQVSGHNMVFRLSTIDRCSTNAVNPKWVSARRVHVIHGLLAITTLHQFRNKQRLNPGSSVWISR